MGHGDKYSGNFTRIVLYSNIYPIDSCTGLFNNPILRGIPIGLLGD